MQLGNRYSQHSFAQIPDVNMARSQFDRSHTVKDTFEFDYLTPIIVDEIIPGDTMNLTLKTFMRLASPTKVPVMDNMYVDFFFFFVPNRLIWTNWERFNGAQDNPGDSTDYTIPQIETTLSGFGLGSLADHFGIPHKGSVQTVNALPFRAYNLIWNEWFRDQNLQGDVVVDKDNGPDTASDYTLLKRGKRHDYFTSCLPWPQKGDAVELPIGTSAPVYGNTKSLGLTDGTTNWGLTTTGASVFTGSTGVYNTNKATTGGGAGSTIGASRILGVVSSGESGLYADLSTATAATINQLRQAMMVQSLLELDARGGTRYTEILLNHFNVVSPDFRLQRPEYLGGGRTRINLHPVAQTSPTSGSNAQAQLAAFATAAALDNDIGFTKSFDEHGYVIGLACPIADITYQQGLHRMWSRSTRYDFFWPKLQQLGEQAVLNKEIWYNDDANDDLVFGYQERYAEYRYCPSSIRGEFRSDFSTPLDMWHMAQDFATLPALNATFIQSSTPISRALAITDGPDLLGDLWFQIKHARPMMTYSVPATLGRF